MKIINPRHKLIGHRGVAGLRPENTYCSFSCAADLDLDWIEFDVQLTKDNEWIVIHDNTLDRTTNGKGRVKNFTLAQIELLEAGLWYNPPYKNQPIPTLAKTLKLAKDHKLNVNIEVKDSEDDFANHAKLMATFLETVANTINIDILISSFDLQFLIYLRKLQPYIPIGYLVDNFNQETIGITITNKFDSINCDVETITQNDLKIAQSHNIPVFLYTVNNKNLAKKWFDLGVNAVFTDRPDLLL